MKPSKKLRKLLKKCEGDIKNGDNLSPVFIDMKEMDRYLARL